MLTSSFGLMHNIIDYEYSSYIKCQCKVYFFFKKEEENNLLKSLHVQHLIIFWLLKIIKEDIGWCPRKYKNHIYTTVFIECVDLVYKHLEAYMCCRVLILVWYAYFVSSLHGDISCMEVYVCHNNDPLQISNTASTYMYILLEEKTVRSADLPNSSYMWSD